MILKIKILLLLKIFFISCLTFSQVIARYENGFLETKDGVLILHVSGTPYERGLQHGKLLKEKINGLISAYIDGQVKKIVSDEMLKQAEKKVEKFILDEFREEMRGIADGSEIPYEKILHSHIFLDLFVNPNQQRLKKMLFQCSNFVGFGEATKDRKLIHGRNLDWWDWGILSDYHLIIFVKPDKGNAYVSIGWPGSVGVLTGMNEKGISIGQTVIRGTDNQVEGVPHFFLIRQVIQYANNLQEAERIIINSPRTTCWTVMISDGKIPDATLIEYSAKNYSLLKPKNKILYATNHFVSDNLQDQMKVYAPTENTLLRYTRWGELARDFYGKIDRDTVIKFLSDHFNPQEKKEVPHYNTICQSTTLQSVVFLPSSLEIYVALSTKDTPAPHRKYNYFDLKKEIKRK